MKNFTMIMKMNRKIKTCPICGAGFKYLSKHLKLVHKVGDSDERQKLTKSAKESMTLKQFAEFLYNLPFTINQLQNLKDNYSGELKLFIKGKSPSEKLKRILKMMHEQYVE